MTVIKKSLFIFFVFISIFISKEFNISHGAFDKQQRYTFMKKQSNVFRENIDKEKKFFKQINQEKNIIKKTKLFQEFAKKYYDDYSYDYNDWKESPLLQQSKDLDIHSLQIVNKNYIKDKNWVYYLGYLHWWEIFEYNNKIFHILTGADIETFEIKSNYSRLKNQNTKDPTNLYTHSISFDKTEMYIEYAKDKNAIYSNGLIIPNANSKYYHLLPYGILAKDNKHVFFRNRYQGYAPELILGWVDATTFEVLNWNYAKDKNAVYMIFWCSWWSGRETCIKKIKKADPKTFHIYTGKNKEIDAIDKYAVYTKQGQRVERGDSETYQTLGSYQALGVYAKDKNAVYGNYCGLEGEEKGLDTYDEVIYIKEADTKTFTLTCSWEKDWCHNAKDKNYTYDYCEIVDTSKNKKWENKSIGESLMRDNMRNENNTDKRYQDIWCTRYYKDTKTGIIYFGHNDSKVSTDTDHFVKFGEKWNYCNDFAYDDKWTIYRGKHYPDIDKTSLDLHIPWERANETDFVKDKNSIYLLSGEDLIKQSHLDIKTFQALAYSWYDWETQYFEYLFTDKNGIYWKTKLLKHLDKNSFQWIGEGEWLFWGKSVFYFKDKNTVYADGEIIPWADAATFKVIRQIGRYDAQDRNNYYQAGKKINPWEVLQYQGSKKYKKQQEKNNWREVIRNKIKNILN